MKEKVVWKGIATFEDILACVRHSQDIPSPVVRASRIIRRCYLISGASSLVVSPGGLIIQLKPGRTYEICSAAVSCRCVVFVRISPDGRHQM
ncbi:MAG: hypothetical protein ACRDGA_03675, partial [Bacteroidota bacterium]